MMYIHLLVIKFRIIRRDENLGGVRQIREIPRRMIALGFVLLVPYESPLCH